MRATKSTERGMVSILVTMIMMIVITLIIIGISQVTRSNRREQLDQQLSTQAYYAAESGLNQAVEFFAANPTAKINTLNSPGGNCTSFINSGGASGLGLPTNGNVLDSTTNISYTCLMVNSTPATLQKAPLTQDSNTIWHVQESTGAAFTELRFQWSPNGDSLFTGPTNTCLSTSATVFPAYANWKCAFGILRVDLVSTSGTVAGTTLENVAKTLYLVPTFTASGVTTGTVQAVSSPATNAGQVVYVKCTSTLCDVRLSPWAGSGDYYARLSVIYQDSDTVTLSGANASGSAKFSSGQAVIDVTGKAQDQLRRLQARIPLNVSTTPAPYFALQSTYDLCKELNVAAGLNSLDGCL